MKQLGLNCYRFSIAWSRLLPNGTGAVNAGGVKHYHEFIDALLENNIQPFVTLFHWDIPQALEEKGAWANPEAVNWYREYANLVLKSYRTKVKYFLTFNEPFIDLFLIRPIVRNVLARAENPMNITDADYGEAAMQSNHLLLANAQVIRDLRDMGSKSQIGLALPLAPALPL